MNKKYIEIVLNVLFWVSTTLLVVLFFSIESIEIEIIDDEELQRISRNRSMMYYFIIGQVLFAGYFYFQMFLIQKLIRKSKNKTLFLKSIMSLLTCLFIYLLIVNYLPLESKVIDPVSLIIFLFYAVTAIGYSFIKIWYRSEQNRKQLELVKNQAELNLLRQQLHPHFLFNTMNNLLAMVDQSATPKLAKSFDKLSNLLRYVVYETKNDKVSIEDEINFIQNFSDLHLLRFEEGEIDYKLEVIGNNKQQLIASGILLCFVENAFKHGVQPETQSFIHININLIEKNKIIVEIENSIPSKNENKISGGYGLKATKERLTLVYKSNFNLEITENKTYKIQLKINTNGSNNS